MEIFRFFQDNSDANAGNSSGRRAKDVPFEPLTAQPRGGEKNGEEPTLSRTDSFLRRIAPCRLCMCYSLNYLFIFYLLLPVSVYESRWPRGSDA